MDKTINTVQTDDQLTRIVQDVVTTGDWVIVEQDGKAVAVVAPIEWYAQWQRSREAFFKRMDEASLRANMDPDEAEALVESVVREVRATRQQ
ncbi:MAG: type II toxin-antitoxin system Phd/YefM family antitoxin [Chloroflexota bacterium]|nr:type II toxin-antitoxin system Phd/YefM family antitoxin [Chloroflexota bacterium]